MKNGLLLLVAVLAMPMAWAQTGGITIAPFGATPDQDITITIDPAAVCGDGTPGLATSAIVRLHAGITVGGRRWQSVVSATGSNDAIVGFTKNPNGTWSKTFNPAVYFGVPAASITELCFVLNGGPAGATLWSQKGGHQDPTTQACGDGFAPFPLSAPWAPCVPIAAPTVAVQGPTTICPGGSVTLTAPTSLGYIWSNGATSRSINANQTGTYTVRTITGPCTSAVSNSTAITVKKGGTYVGTFAGSGTAGFAGGQGVLAAFNAPSDIAIDTRGNLYVADALNHRIRRIIRSGLVSSFAGAGTAGFADNVGQSARFNEPRGIAVDTGGLIYVADTKNHRIRKINQLGAVTTVAGGGIGATSDGQGTAANFLNPSKIAVDLAGTLYVTQVSCIRKITPTGLVTTLAGSTQASALAFANGQGSAARFNKPAGIAVDATGQIYVADNGNHRIRKITPGGLVTTFAGSGVAGSADGTALSAQLDRPQDLAFDAAGNLLVVDGAGARIRSIAPDGVVTTLAGSTLGYADGQAAWAKLNTAEGIAIAKDGTVFITETTAPRVRQIPTFDAFAPPILQGSEASICDGARATLEAAPGFAYLWSTGDTARSIQVGTPGAYTVQALAEGCSSAASTPTVVTTKPAPQKPTITANGSTSICQQGASVVLSAPAGFKYLWSNGDTTQTTTISTTGSYTVQTIAAGCSSVASTPLVVALGTAPPAPSITASGQTAFCAGSSVTLTASAAPKYLWSNGDTTRSTTISSQGSYTVRANDNGCLSAPSAPQAVTVTPLPAQPTITSQGPTSVCQAGGTVVLAAPAGFNYLWSNGDTTQTITISTSGNYTLQTITASCSSAASAPTAVFIGTPPPAPSLTANGDTTFCEGKSVVLTASEAARYLWSNGDTTRSIIVSASGTYTVQARGAGCLSAPSSSKIVTVNPEPALPTIVQVGNTLQSSYTTGNQWLTGITAVPGQTQQTFAPVADGQYAVRHTDNKGCTATSTLFDFTLVGTKTQAAPLALRIYPNPTKGHFYIDASQGKGMVRIYNSLGALVYTGTASETALGLPKIATGVYTVEVQTANQTARATLVVQ